MVWHHQLNKDAVSRDMIIYRAHPDWRTVLGLSANAVLEDIKKKKLAEILADPDRCAKYKKKSLEQAAKKAAKRAAEIAEACQPGRGKGGSDRKGTPGGTSGRS